MDGSKTERSGVSTRDNPKETRDLFIVRTRLKENKCYLSPNTKGFLIEPGSLFTTKERGKKQFRDKGR